MNLMRTLIAVAMTALLAGCGVKYYSKVDGLSAIQVPAKSRYLLLPGNKDTTPQDLQFQEYALQVTRALDHRGFVRTDSAADADIAIFVTYAIGDPTTHQYAYSVPVWGQTGTSSSRTTGTASTIGGTTTYNATTTYTPSYGVVGATSGTRNYTTYSRFVVLDAYDVPYYLAKSEMKQVWRTTVTSTGSSGDLRLVMPFMLAAAEPYFGVNTGRQISVVLRSRNKDVARVRGTSVK
jgi:hypothetical protein